MPYVYDEQPTTMKDSWRQRMRWAKGFYQVLLKYGSFLFNGIFKGKQGRFACYDMFMTIAPGNAPHVGGRCRQPRLLPHRHRADGRYRGIRADGRRRARRALPVSRQATPIGSPWPPA